MATLRISKQREVQADIRLQADVEYTVGSSPRSRVMLDSPSVARNHCRIHRENGQWWVVDLGSMDGTRVNGERIEAARLLQSGDDIRVGGYLLRLETGESAPAGTGLQLEYREPSPAAAGDALPDGAAAASIRPSAMPRRTARERRLVLVREGARPAAVDLTKPVTLIGSGAHCDLRIDGLFVRQEQAAILKDDTGCRIISQGGFHSLRVNGERVGEAYLVPGDDIRLAGYRFSLRAL
jgi:pSer/pThr/pTyr-binding forkhead associated (FHA) protein